MLCSRIIILNLMVLYFGASIYAQEMPPQSGVISSASEAVTIKTTPLKGSAISRKAGVGQAVYLNDEIRTSANAKAQILLKDQSVFNIGPNSTLIIDKFVYDPSKSALNVSIQKGAFKFVSGKIATSSDEAMKVNLPNATIAVRGTGVAGVVEPNGSATVMLLHGVVDVTSTTNNATSTLSKSGWGVQINPAGNVSAPAPVPADLSRNIMQTAKVSPAASTASNANTTTTNSSTQSGSTTAGSASGGSSASQTTTVGNAQTITTQAPPQTANTTANQTGQFTPESTTVLSSAIAANAPAVSAAVSTGTNNAGSMSLASTGTSSTALTTTLVSSNVSSVSNTVSTTNANNLAIANATAAIALGNAQLTTASTNLSAAQTYNTAAVLPYLNTLSAKSDASWRVAYVTGYADLIPSVADNTKVYYFQLANAYANSIDSAASSASAYAAQTSSVANQASDAATLSTQAGNSAITYATTATQQANIVTGNTLSNTQDVTSATALTSQANTITSTANTNNTAAATAISNAGTTSSNAQVAANDASAYSLTAAASVLGAYQTALTAAQSLTPYETISQTIANSGALNPLGNVTFSTSNVAMSCITGVNCGGSSSAATINSHAFTFNFQNATVTNSYNISYSNFNGYTGLITGTNSATATNWKDATTVSLPVTGQVSSNPVSAAMDVILSSVGSQSGTNRANLATVFTTINSGSAYMGVGNSGYKILGKSSVGQ